MYIFISALINLFHDKIKPEFYMTLVLLALQQMDNMIKIKSHLLHFTDILWHTRSEETPLWVTLGVTICHEYLLL